MQTKNKKVVQLQFVQYKSKSSENFRAHTNKLPESELHFGLVGTAATHELRLHFQVFQLQGKYFLLQGLLKPRAPLLIWTQVRDGEADGEAQQRGVDSQRHMAVRGSMAVIKENLCEGLMLWN